MSAPHPAVTRCTGQCQTLHHSSFWPPLQTEARVVEQTDQCVAPGVLRLSLMSAFRASPCPQLEAGLVDRERRVLPLQLPHHRRQLCPRRVPHYRAPWLL